MKIKVLGMVMVTLKLNYTFKKRIASSHIVFKRIQINKLFSNCRMFNRMLLRSVVDLNIIHHLIRVIVRMVVEGR